MLAASEPRFGEWLAHGAPLWTAPLRATFLELALWQWIGLGLALALSYAAGLLVSRVFTRVVCAIGTRSGASWGKLLASNFRRPVGGLVTLLVLRALIPALGLGDEGRALAWKLLVVAFIANLAWLLVCVVRFVTDAIEAHAERQHDGDASAGPRLLGLKTQLMVLRRVVVVLVTVTGGALVLLQFEPVRNIGMSMLASAGVAGIVVGLAAQKPVGALLAGLQMSITQPIRIGDKVMVEDEFGTIEEINLSHVVVELWDERRLIVPTTYFLDNTFQNWTRTSPALTGYVFLYCDFTLPVDAVRAELERVVAENPLWDKRVAKVEVTDVSDRTMQLRALVSAADAVALGDLKNAVRERLVAWLRDFEAGRHLPRTRLDSTDDEPEQPAPRANGVKRAAGAR